MGRFDPLVRSAFRATCRPTGSTAHVVGARGESLGRLLDAGEAGAASWLQQRTLAPTLPPPARAQPHAPGHVPANAPRRRTARDHRAYNRSHRAGNRLPQSIRLFECVHQMDWLASGRVSAQKIQEFRDPGKQRSSGWGFEITESKPKSPRGYEIGGCVFNVWAGELRGVYSDIENKAEPVSRMRVPGSSPIQTSDELV